MDHAAIKRHQRWLIAPQAYHMRYRLGVLLLFLGLAWWALATYPEPAMRRNIGTATQLGLPCVLTFVLAGLIVDDPALEILTATGFPLRRLWLIRSAYCLLPSIAFAVGVGITKHLTLSQSYYLIVILLVIWGSTSLLSFGLRRSAVSMVVIPVILSIQAINSTPWVVYPQPLFFESLWFKKNVMRYLYLTLDGSVVPIEDPELYRPLTNRWLSGVAFLTLLASWYLAGREERLLAPRRDA